MFHNVRSLVTTSAVVAALASIDAAAHPFIVDQSATGLVGGDAFGNGTGITVAAGAAQSFVPTLSSLSVVELQINDQSPGNGQSVDLVVNIRDGGLGGAILGTSNVVTRADGGPNASISLLHFDFGAPVALTPGQTYVMEVITVSGFEDSGVFFAGTGIPDSYPQGTAFIFGLPFTNSRDLWFREGPTLSLPSTLLLLSLGVTGLGISAWRRKANC